jgi:tagaturonate reductase
MVKTYQQTKLMQLSRKIVKGDNDMQLPDEKLFGLPERILQFGTGVFLRGLPDHVIDKANKQDVFNGRIVVVKSTGNGGTDVFARQDGLYTLLERGIEDGNRIERVTVNASISRVLSAEEEWEEILTCAVNPAIQVILSNTTEIGIVLAETDAYSAKPASFPGRVLSILEQRYRAFNGSHESGMVIVPTELIVDNGTALKNIVITLARLRGLDDAFLTWLDTANDFCNSLVDRIVPGKLPADEHAGMEQRLGYRDELMIMAEPYLLWAIETSRQRTRDILSFTKADKGVIITPDINKFRELKLRLLNGAHTFSCGLACLAGFSTVKEAMNDPVFSEYISGVMINEIIPLIAGDTISLQEANDFAAQVLDRFRNPFIEHQWLSITVQYTSKMAMRTVPLIARHYAVSRDTPELMALGFAAHILFTRPKEHSGEAWYGHFQGTTYPIPDDKAKLMQQHWQSTEIDSIASVVLSDTGIFGEDLTQHNGFAETVQSYLVSLVQQGAEKTLRSVLVKQPAA